MNPLSVDTSYPVIGAPPVDPATNAIDNAWLLPVTEEIVGAVGGPEGTTFTLLLALLWPTSLMALSCTAYVVPFTSPVTTIGPVVDAGDRVIHVAPLSME